MNILSSLFFAGIEWSVGRSFCEMIPSVRGEAYRFEGVCARVVEGPI